MQISAANLLIAAQQGAKPRPEAGAFAAALAKEKTPFEPLAFKQTAEPAPPPAPSPAPAPAAKPAVPSPVGSRIDIKV